MENPFKWRHFQPEIIFLRPVVSCVFAQLSRLGRNDDRTGIVGGSHDHLSLGSAYAPEIDKRSRPYLKQTNDSWRVDETYVKVRGSGCICIERSIQPVRRSISS